MSAFHNRTLRDCAIHIVTSSWRPWAVDASWDVRCSLLDSSSGCLGPLVRVLMVLQGIYRI